MKGPMNSILKEKLNSSEIGQKWAPKGRPIVAGDSSGQILVHEQKEGQEQLKIQVKLLCMVYTSLHGLVPTTLSRLFPSSY